MQVSPLPIPEALAVLSAIKPDLCPAAQSVVCVHAVCAGNSALLPKIFMPERVKAIEAVLMGVLANAAGSVGNGMPAFASPGIVCRPYLHSRSLGSLGNLSRQFLPLF